MSTEQKRSFIASIRYNGDDLGFLRERFMPNGSQPNLLTNFSIEERISRSENGWSVSGGFAHNRAVFGSHADPETPSFEMIGYFRCYEDYYNIQIRSKDYFGNFLSKNDDGSLGAFPPAGGNTTSFNLLDASLNIITLDDIEAGNASVYFKARHAGLIKLRQHWVRDPGAPTQQSPFNTFGDHSGSLARFELKILERNVPYPTRDVPYA